MDIRGALPTGRPQGNKVRPLGVVPADDFLNMPLEGGGDVAARDFNMIRHSMQYQHVSLTRFLPFLFLYSQGLVRQDCASKGRTTDGSITISELHWTTNGFYFDDSTVRAGSGQSALRRLVRTGPEAQAAGRGCRQLGCRRAPSARAATAPQGTPRPAQGDTRPAATAPQPGTRSHWRTVRSHTAKCTTWHNI